jgi:hypothetical protein
MLVEYPNEHQDQEPLESVVRYPFRRSLRAGTQLRAHDAAGRSRAGCP